MTVNHSLKVWSVEGPSDSGTSPINLKAKAVVAAHDKDINSIAVCSGSLDRTACIWRLLDLVQVVVPKGHKRGIWSVEFSPVDQCVLTAFGDKAIKIWHVSDGSCLKTFEVKLRTIKSNECIVTYDHHEDKIKGVSELLEGLIPYTQRYFSRIDRLVRSTFLLDYILAGMSVIEPDLQTESKVESLLHSETNNPDDGIAEQDHTEESVGAKKRKSNKSKHSSHKKVDTVACNKVETI